MNNQISRQFSGVPVVRAFSRLGCVGVLVASGFAGSVEVVRAEDVGAESPTVAADAAVVTDSRDGDSTGSVTTGTGSTSESTIPDAAPRPAAVSPDAQEPVLSLQRAIETALRNSPEIAVLAITPAENEQGINDALSSMDTRLQAEALKTRDVSPSSSALLGNTLVEETVQGNISAASKFSTGTEASLEWRNQRQETSALFQTYSPAYTSALTLNLMQPLLKGAWGGRPEIRVQFAQATHDASVWDYRAALANQVKRVISVYWNQRLAEESVEVGKRSLKLAERLLEEADAAVRVGLQAPLALSEANSQAASRREELIVAENALLTAGNELRRTLGQEDIATESGPVRLGDHPVVEQLTLIRDESIQTAIHERPEIRSAEFRVRGAELNLRTASNGLLPEVNIVGSVGVDGLAGKFRQPQIGNTSGQTGADPQNTQRQDFFAGNYPDSLDGLGSGDYYAYSGGVQIRYPLENRAAKSQFERAKLALTRERLNQKTLQQRISVEVHNALGDVESARQRVSAGTKTKEFAVKSYETGLERYRVGLSTTRETLELQKDLASAELALARALVDYQVAVAELLRARGDLLSKYKITVEGNS